MYMCAQGSPLLLEWAQSGCQRTGRVGMRGIEVQHEQKQFVMSMQQNAKYVAMDGCGPHDNMRAAQLLPLRLRELESGGRVALPAQA